jgi:Family of unknown function (DUF6084)
MSSLSFAVIGARAEPYAAVPILVFRLQIAETSGEQVHAMVLRCQIQIEPRRRHYSPEEEERLLELFGEPHRWGDTLRTVVWAHASLTVPGFQGRTEVDLPVTCTYDFEVASAKYFHALGDGEIPLLFLFSGTVFTKGQSGFSVEPVPWEKEATYRLPVRVWRELMDRYFPGSAWIRLGRDSFDALHRFKGRRALPTWDDAIEVLLDEAGETERT